MSIINISLYIPRVFANISKERVRIVFEELTIGKVSNIDFVSKMCDQTHTQYNGVYVHFEYWYDNTVSRNFQERVLDPNREARIVYDDPWFWIVLENKAKKYVSADRKPRIVLNVQEDKEVSQPKKQMTNKDFSDLFNKQVTSPKISDLIIPKLIRSTTHYEKAIIKDMEEIEAYLDNHADMRKELNSAMRKELNSEMNSAMRKELNSEMRKELNSEMRKELNSEIRKVNSEIRKELNSAMRKELNWEMRKEEGEIVDDDSIIMDEIEALMEETEQQNNQYLIHIDGRYVQELERENVALRESVMRLQKLNTMLSSQIPNNASRSTGVYY
jgi:hypothetical protein